MDSVSTAAEFRETLSTQGSTWLRAERGKLQGQQVQSKKVADKESVEKTEVPTQGEAQAINNLSNVISKAAPTVN